jgi:hypothetical protein
LSYLLLPGVGLVELVRAQVVAVVAGFVKI